MCALSGAPRPGAPLLTGERSCRPAPATAPASGYFPTSVASLQTEPSLSERIAVPSLQSVFGIILLLGTAWILSERRQAISPKRVATGVALQFAVAVALLKLPLMGELFMALNGVVLAVDRATTAGTGFVFGYLGGGALPFVEPYPGAAFVLAFKGLPIVLVMSALSALLYHWKILPWIVRGIARALTATLGLGGATGLATAANVFVGMVEAPLLVRPYLASLTRSELFVLMTGGMATIAGTMMVLYATVLGPVIPDAMGHILTASLISAPAAVTVALIMIPETGAVTAGEVFPPSDAGSAMDAVTRGTAQGVHLLIQIVAMLVVLVALVSLVNQGLSLVGDMADAPVTLERLLGWLLAPVAWGLGVPWDEAATAGSLMGVKVVLNEFLAYLQMAQLPAGALSERSALIMTYALCGFANLGSLGIMIGGMGAMAPERREEIVGLGMRSIVSGNLASFMTGAVIGALV
ncbi:MAG: nucleoside:proton symporter [Nitrospinae bacterium]|nr:nucleoside:proton symporter [Nitrospinota bacterium]